MRLLLIRHGQTPNNVTGALDTAFPGTGLTSLGQAQAEAIPGALAEEPVDAVYASPLLRARLTAAPLAATRGVDVEVRQGLEEISAGDLELRADREAGETYTGCVASWLRGDVDRRMPGGTTGREFFDRYHAAVTELAADHGADDTVAVVSHGAAIRAYVSLAAGLAPEVATELRIKNTGMGVLEGLPGSGWRLSRWAPEPLGGAQLADAAAHDVTGDSAEEARPGR